ncbi:MAG: PKD domain-containing protein [Methanoregula sp.]|jgi:PKD repeat protein|nr:PKD domain-containing protein [Methanoregula sp.]
MSNRWGVLLLLFVLGVLVIPVSAFNVTGFGGMVWQKCLGGLNGDNAQSIQQTADGGYIVAGKSNSNDGNVTGNHGNYDYWVVKLTATGTLDWQKCLGGLNEDNAQSIQQTTDGGYIVAGFTYSNDGNVTGNHGSADYWVVKLDSTGTTLWQKCLGGLNHDNAKSIQQTADGGYIIAGYTYSNNGNVTGNHGNYDYWVVKLDNSGNLLWQKCLGGINIDHAVSIHLTGDGGFIIAGSTASNDGNVDGNHGNYDYWVVKLDNSGNLLWQKCLGGTNIDYAYSIQQTGDGGYIVVGFAHSNDGNVTGSHGSADYWVVKLDNSGNLLWQKCLGGTNIDYAYSIQQTGDGGYIVVGYTRSNDGNVMGNHGESDYWVVKLDNSGNLLWQKCLGGTDYDDAFSVQQTADGGYIIAGETTSNNGNVYGNHGSSDYWVVKLNPDITADFGADRTSGSAPLNIQFEDKSHMTGISLWNWSFGDGTFSTLKNPMHTYSYAGKYSVSMSISDNKSKFANATVENYILVDALPAIHLSTGWNFVSTPRVLQPGSNNATIFSKVNTSGRSIWLFNASTQQWTVMGQSSLVKPLDGIWIYSVNQTDVLLNFSTDPLAVAAPKPVFAGWNAIGYAGQDPAPAWLALQNIENAWVRVIGFNASIQQYDNPIANHDTSSSPYNQYRELTPTRGYWLLANSNTSLYAFGM